MGTNDLKSNYNLVGTPYYIGSGHSSYYFSGYNHPSYVDGTYYANTSLGYANITPGAYVSSAIDTADLKNLASLSANNVIRMASAGAKYIIAPNVVSPTYSAAVAVGLGPRWTEMAVNSIAYYNQAFWNDIAAAGVNFIPADFSSLFNYVALNTSTFGFTNHSAYSPACGTTTAAYNCTTANLASNPNSYLFADFIGHASSAYQTIQAQYVQSLVVAPSQISMIAESAIQNRTNLMNTFRQQIPLTFQNPNVLQVWASGDLSHNTMTQSTGFTGGSGTPYTVSLGLGYRLSSEVIVGGAFSNIAGIQSYSSGGQYNQNENVISAYAGFESEQFWGNGILSYGNSGINSNRQVTLGTTTQSNSGNTSGSNTSASIEGGYNFLATLDSAEIKHSPIVGITFQKAYISGLNEGNNSGAPTALSFGSQNRNSSISELGYQANIQLGMFQPFARFTWNNELADTNRNITTSLNSVAAPSYTMPATQFGNNWTTGQVGCNVKFSPTIMGYALINQQYSQNNKTNTFGSIGLNIGL
jgi:outer membrane lipase/esterase